MDGHYEHPRIEIDLQSLLEEQPGGLDRIRQRGFQTHLNQKSISLPWSKPLFESGKAKQ
jgi:hypothetical protein